LLLAVDVDYRDRSVVTACVGFAAWSDAATLLEWVVEVGGRAADYEPGQFYRRELPYLIAAIAAVRTAHAVDGAIVDGHVWLDAGRPGLGAHLHAALGGSVWVVGVAKGEYRGGAAAAVVRGESRVPLYVTAVGMDAGEAAEHVERMHGEFRMPTLLKRVDQLARGLALAKR
jgi:deoxyribonuclease V